MRARCPQLEEAVGEALFGPEDLPLAENAPFALELRKSCRVRFRRVGSTILAQQDPEALEEHSDATLLPGHGGGLAESGHGVPPLLPSGGPIGAEDAAEDVWEGIGFPVGRAKLR